MRPVTLMFPEVHVAQYPLDMGRPGAKAASTDVVSVEIEPEGGRGDGGLQGTSGDWAVKVALVFRRPLVP